MLVLWSRGVLTSCFLGQTWAAGARSRVHNTKTPSLAGGGGQGRGKMDWVIYIERKGADDFYMVVFWGKDGALVVEKRVHVKGWILEGIKEERRRKGERRNCGCQTSDTSRPGSTIRHTHLHFLDQTRLHPIQKTTGKQNTHPPIETNLFTQLFCFSSYEKYWLSRQERPPTTRLPVLW